METNVLDWLEVTAAACPDKPAFLDEDSAVTFADVRREARIIGTAAAKLMLRYCFEQELLHRVYLRALSENLQAIRSYEKAGFVREGLLRDDVCIDGVYRDIVWMAAVNPAD